MCDIEVPDHGLTHEFKDEPAILRVLPGRGQVIVNQGPIEVVFDLDKCGTWFIRDMIAKLVEYVFLRSERNDSA